MPPSVRIVREKHPFEGQCLNVLGHQHRQGTLYLTLALPEGGTSLIPAAWTNMGISLAAGANEKLRSRTLGSATELIHARAVVDALLCRLDSAYTSPATEEGPNAAGAIAFNHPVSAATAGVGSSESGAAHEAHRGPRTTDQEDSACRAEGGSR